jgi:flagellar hook-associated protein 3 FlgL
MRISTSQIYTAGTDNINRNQSELFRLQNQISTGRRILRPEDDPVAAAQALVTTQSQQVNKQYQENQANARAQLGLLDGQLDSLGNVIQDVRERTIQLGNASLTDRERGFIAEELESRLEQLLSIANAQNGEGLYLFAGFQGATVPFARAQGATGPFDSANPLVNFFGDQGERRLQIDASRQMPVNLSGIELFMNILNGNGTFVTRAATTNAGTGVNDAGSVINVGLWNASLVQPQDFTIQFGTDTTLNPPVLKYNLIDNASGNSMFTNAAPGTPDAAGWQIFTPGQAIAFSGLDATFATTGDLGIQLTINGTPADGDSFAVQASSPQSLFDTVKNIADLASTPIPGGPAGNVLYTNGLGEGLVALDRALDRVLDRRATTGTRLKELDALGESSADLDLQYTGRVSELQDLDYAAALSDFTRRQVQLEAAQRSFIQTARLTLFDYF